ncbi:MAG: DNA replication/repair protein RecF [Actinobacteria bacterium]|nr:DNA replication/repair protein RecF [Actinomycetota bacterium]
MYLEKLELRNYRNYEHVSLEFGSDSVLILGDNGQGKTNLLESIYFLSTGKSHRTQNQSELINWGADYSILRAVIKGSHLLEIELRRDAGIKVRIDKTYQKRKKDFVFLLPAVIFSPDDLKVVKESPSNRRDFLDEVLEKVDPAYAYTKSRYQKVLLQRNSLLKSLENIGQLKNPGIASTFETWNEYLVNYGVKIIEKRVSLIRMIRDKFKEYISYFFGIDKSDIIYLLSWGREAGLDYQGENYCNFPADGGFEYGNFASNSNSDSRYELDKEINEIKEIKERYLSKLEENLDKDLMLKTTSIGPHRDDFVILLGGRDLRFFGSQGQQRIATLSLKLCEVFLVEEKTSRTPVLLLDDVLSELDLERKKLLMEMMGHRFQTFVTTANINSIEDLKDAKMRFGKKYMVKNGNVYQWD